MDADQFRRAAHASVEQIIAYIENVQDRPVVAQVKPGYLAPLLPASAPEEPEEWDAIQKDIERAIQPGMTHWTHPGFMAWFSGNGSSYASTLGELWSATLNAPAFNWLCSPAITELETIVLDWLAELFRLPPVFLSTSEGGGVIQGSASEALLVCMVAARERVLKRRTAHLSGEEREEAIAALRGRLVALGSAQSHSCTPKGVRVAGVRYVAIHCTMDDGLAITGQALAVAIEKCEAKGLIPFWLTATLGTTATCAIDRFEEIAEIKVSQPDLWVHIDAAWAGSALLLPEYQHYSPQLAFADSFNTNMHKWLLTNFDASLLYVRRRRDLTDALSITPSYLRNDSSISGLVIDYRDWQIPLGRRFRALKIWFVLRSYGAQGLRNHVNHGIQLGEYFASLVKTRPDILKLVAGPSFTLVVLTIIPRSTKKSLDDGHEHISETSIADGAGAVDITAAGELASGHDLAEANRTTQAVYERVNASGEVFITSGVVNGVYAIRVTSATVKSDDRWVKKAFDAIVQNAEAVLDMV